MRNFLKFFLTLLILLVTIPMKGQQKTIIVGYGETFETIAVKYGINLSELRAANPDKDDCFAGMEIVVPQPQTSPIGETGITSVVILQADSLLIEAKGLSGLGLNKKAIKIYNKILDMNVRTPYAYAGRGECYFNLKQYKKARADLNQAIYSGQLADYEKEWCEEALEDVNKAIQEKIKRRRAAWANVGLSFAAFTAAAATTYIASEQSKNQSQGYQNMHTYYGAGSDHLRNADQITAQSDVALNQWKMQGNAQLNQMTQNFLVYAKNSQQRLFQADRELYAWSADFEKKNGRQPTLYEQDQWYAAHYPDLMESRIMARGKMYGESQEKDNKGGAGEDDRYKTDYKEKFENRYSSGKDCVMCLGSGDCKTCNGKGWYYNSYDLSKTVSCPNCDRNHNGKCSHCHGTGKNP